MIQVIQPPANGTVVITRTFDYPNFPRSNPRSVCNRAKRPATQAIYKPRPGFVGTDQVVLDTILPTGGLVRGTSNIVVR